MAKENKLKVKNYILRLIREQEESFFYLAPDIVGSINNANLDLGKKTFVVDFNTTDGRDMKLTVPHKCFQKWENNFSNKDDNTHNFLLTFLKLSNQLGDDEMLDEIVDEFGEIMPDEERIANANFRSVGKSKFDTEKTIKQTVPKSKRYYGDLGLGVITW